MQCNFIFEGKIFKILLKPKKIHFKTPMKIAEKENEEVTSDPLGILNEV